MASKPSMESYYQALGILRNPMLRIRPDEVIEALMPLLESDDRNLVRAADRLIRTQIRCDTPEAVDADFGSRIMESMLSGKPLPAGLSRFLFRHYPSATLITFARYAHLSLVEGDPRPEAVSEARRKYLPTYQEIIRGEHAIAEMIWKQRNWFLAWNEADPEAVRQLHKLAQRKEWWVRLYVAEMMRQVPALRDRALMRRLAKDPHKLVRETIHEFEREPDIVRPARP